MSLTAEQIEKSRAEFEKFKSSVSYVADPDFGSIEFYIDEKYITTWSYADDPNNGLEEFLLVMQCGWLARQETLCEQKPNMTKMKSVMVSIT